MAVKFISIIYKYLDPTKFVIGHTKEKVVMLLGYPQALESATRNTRPRRLTPIDL